jgi:hypothetical protein
MFANVLIILNCEVSLHYFINMLYHSTVAKCTYSFTTKLRYDLSTAKCIQNIDLCLYYRKAIRNYFDFLFFGIFTVRSWPAFRHDSRQSLTKKTMNDGTKMGDDKNASRLSSSNLFFFLIYSSAA